MKSHQWSNLEPGKGLLTLSEVTSMHSTSDSPRSATHTELLAVNLCAVFCEIDSTPIAYDEGDARKMYNGIQVVHVFDQCLKNHVLTRNK